MGSIGKSGNESVVTKESARNLYDFMESRVVNAIMSQGATRAEASKEAFNIIQAFTDGEIEPEVASDYGLTPTDITKLNLAGQIVALQNYITGKDKRVVIDPLGNLVKVRRRSKAEKNTMGNYDKEWNKQTARTKLQELKHRYKELG